MLEIETGKDETTKALKAEIWWNMYSSESLSWRKQRWTDEHFVWMQMKIFLRSSTCQYIFVKANQQVFFHIKQNRNDKLWFPGLGRKSCLGVGGWTCLHTAETHDLHCLVSGARGTSSVCQKQSMYHYVSWKIIWNTIYSRAYHLVI